MKSSHLKLGVAADVDGIWPLESFGRNGSGRQWYCRECFREHFRARGELHLAQTADAKKARQHAAYRYVRDLKKRSACRDCAATDWRLLEFDHLVEKYLGITEFLSQGPGTERLKRELDRCEIVCRNCHRRRTAIDQQSWRLDPDAVERLSNRSRSQLAALVWLRDVLAKSSCADCGVGELVVLEFDHLRDKEADISALVQNGYSIATIEAEAAKCEIVCANCHKVRTMARASNAQAS